MNARSKLLLTTIFLFGLALTGVTLAALARIAEAGDSPRLSVARVREVPAPPSITQVHALFLARRYAEAYGRYAELADAGDPAAASMALTMVAHGPVLFGSDWSAASGQLRRWSALAQQLAVHLEASIAAHDRGE